MELERHLNARQREAVLHEGGPLLLLAGAGSGKTRALTFRIAHLISRRGIAPWRILAITFTNKAADEMKARVEDLLGADAAGIWIGTFHAVCLRILRRHIDRLGFEKNFVVYDEVDQLRVIRSALRESTVSEHQVRPIAVRALLDKAKNHVMDPRFLLPRDEVARRVISEVIDKYRRVLREANALDFGDLIVYAIRLFQECPDLKEEYRHRFHSVLVDEYQDTNRAQHILLQHLMPLTGDLCVVGDDDQSIYRWRGAEVNNLLRFEEDFPGTKVIVLEENYRSTGNILRAADAVARENPERREKRLWTSNETGRRLQYLEAATPEREAEWIIREILSLVEAGETAYGEIGIFFRTNAQSRPFEERLALARIPHAVIGSLRFYERAEVKDLISYLRFLANPRDSVALERIVNRPARGIGPATLATLQVHASGRGIPLWEAIEEAVEARHLTGTAARRVREFRDMISALLREGRQDPSPGRLLKRVLERTGYGDFLRGMEDGEKRLENVEELLRTARQFQATEAEDGEGTGGTELEAFLQKIALVSDIDRYEERANRVCLMTLHSAKGLEFPVVFLTGMEEGILPHQRSLFSEEALSEERRLCYVGMTRAKRLLYLTRARFRTVYGKSSGTEPSRFLASIPPDLVEPRHETDHLGPATGTSRDSAFPGMKREPEAPRPPDPLPPFLADRPPPPSRARLFRVGDHVEHETLGTGVVRKVEGTGDKERITVQFYAVGIRKLMVRLAPLRKIR